MERDHSEMLNKVAVTAYTAETGINTPGSPDVSMLCQVGDKLKILPNKVANTGENTGTYEATRVDHLGYTTEHPFNWPQMQPQHAAFVLAYLLGTNVDAASGSGYTHSSTPLSDVIDLYRPAPCFSVSNQIGEVYKRRAASMFMNDATFTFKADDWVSLTANAKGTGLYVDNVTSEEVSALDNATSITLAAGHAVQGATDAERLQNVHDIAVELAEGVFTDVAYSAVSNASAAVITITSAGGSGATVTYNVTCILTESGWMTFPAVVSQTGLRTAGATITVGGTWNGSAIVGGRSYACEIDTVTWNYSNNYTIHRCFGGSDVYGGKCRRGERTQKLTISKEMYDYVMTREMQDNRTFSVQLDCQGDEISSGVYYGLKLTWPQLVVMDNPIGSLNNNNAETVDLKPMESATYNSVYAVTTDAVAAYMA